MVLVFVQGSSIPLKSNVAKHDPEAITLIRNGFWPSTPKQPQVTFELGFIVLP